MKTQMRIAKRDNTELFATSDTAAVPREFETVRVMGVGTYRVVEDGVWWVFLPGTDEVRVTVIVEEWEPLVYDELLDDEDDTG